MSLSGWHWAVSLARPPRYVNVPYWPHRILVIGWGRLDRAGRWHPRQPAVHKVTLWHCCPARQAADGDVEFWAAQR